MLMLALCQAPNSYTLKWFKQFRLETPFIDDNAKSKEKRQNFKICKPISLSIFNFYFSTNFFPPLFWWLSNYFIMVVATAYDKISFTSAGLKDWRHASTNAAIDHSWFFFRDFLLRWSAHVSWCNNVTIKAWCGKSDTYKKTITKLILHSL